MVKCSFCGRDESPVRGVHLIKNDGSVNYFCSSKCRKNALKLGRDKRKLKWTEAHSVNAQKIKASNLHKELEEAKKEESKDSKKEKAKK